MKKLFLTLTACILTLGLWAADVTVVENFSGIVSEYGGDVNTTATANGLVVTGDVCRWNLTFLRWNGNADKITVNEEALPSMWLQYDGTKASKMETTNLEGGIKHVYFRWAQYGAESGNTLKLKVQAGNIEHNPAVTRSGGSGANKDNGGEEYDYDFACKTNGQLEISNVSEKGGGNACRILVANIKITPYLLFADRSNQLMRVGETHTRTIINNTEGEEGTLTYTSSNTSVATVDGNGQVTAVARGEATITAKFAWDGSEDFVETTYNVYVWPADNAWPVNLETFDGAQNIALGGSGTYLAEATASFNPSTATGLRWTSLLGSVRDALGGKPASTDLSAVIRGKRKEATDGYLLSSTISGGIDSLTFEWNSNGSEASRTNPWDIEIYINETKIGTIADACTSQQSLGSWYRFKKGGIKVEGDFTIKIVNKNTADDVSKNQYRFVVDNIEWYGYETYAVTFNGMPSHGLLGVLNGSSPLNSGDKVPAGTVLTIVPTPGTGYEVDEVTVLNGESQVAVTNNQFTMPAGNVTVAATFSLVDYTVTHNAAANGSYTIKVGDAEAVNTNTTANYGQTVTLAAEADYGYEFSEWTVMNGETPVAVDENNQFTMPAGNVTVSATFAALPVKFYIAGDFTSWDDNKIPVYEDSYTIQGLSADPHQLKVVDGSDWKGYSDLTAAEIVAGLYADGSDNICFTLAEAGNVTVTYTNEVFKLEGSFTPQVVKVKGGWVSWDEKHQMTLSLDRKSATVTLEDLPAADEVEFGIEINNDDFRANGYGFKREYNSESGISGFSANMKLTSDKAGDYTFTWTFGTNALTITFPEILVYRVAGDEELMGSDWNTGDDDNAMTLNEGIYKLTKTPITLNAATYKYKVVGDDTWRIAYPSDNAELTINARGVYSVEFTFNPSTKAVSAEATYLGPATAIDETDVKAKAEKKVVDGQLIIEKNGVRYNVIGQAL